ncbi:MAG: ferrous iron transport protein B [Bacteroidales bacterium]|nr:ferrous iron transport protein B [Bacteroidales bacterium]
MRLSELPTGEEAVILSVAGSGAFRKRIIEMGFVKGKLVRAIKNAPLKDPIEYKILDYYVSLRREEAKSIEVIKIDSQQGESVRPGDFSIIEAGEFEPKTNDEKLIRVAFVGNPNCGKTTIFNYLGGTKEHTGNYSGVTVGATDNRFQFGGYTFEIVDLPGTYSISAYSPEETFVRNKLLSYDPDIVLNVLDATNLARNLYLTTQLIDMGERMVIALNMYDDLKASGDTLDYKHFSRMLGTPMVPTVGSKGEGCKELLHKMISVYEGQEKYVRRVRINYGTEIESAIIELCNVIDSRCNLPYTISPRYLAIKLLENDMDFVTDNLETSDLEEVIASMTAIRNRVCEKLHVADLETYMTDMRYGFIDGALSETFVGRVRTKESKSQRIDNVLTHRFWGIPIFVALIWLMFEATFSLGQYPMDWIDAGVEWLGDFVSGLLPDGPVKDLLVDGIITGVGGVIVFLPNILILFLFISFMEDTGYMARAAFIMDKMMHKMGLHGKSFIPLIMGFGCNVPAIMATRTIEDRNNRILTMLVNPFMSCSARLPVYLLFCGAFFPDHAGTMLFGMYVLGVVVAIVMCRIFKSIFFKGRDLPFVMELPPYRMPTMKNTLINMWSKASQYLSKMGGIIMVASIIVWFLGYYPKNEEFDQRCEAEVAQLSAAFAADSLAVAEPDALELKIDSVKRVYAGYAQEYSFIGRIGKFIEPAIRPLGFDWKMGVSLVSGVAAKEIVVSTLSVLYNTDDGDDASLINSLRNERRDGELFFNRANVLAFMTFTLLYFPCVATLTAIRNESSHWNDFNTTRRHRRKHKSSWRWSVFVACYTTALAWVMAFIVYHIFS